MIRDRINENPKLVNILYYTLLDVLKMMAPFTPFLVEDIYQDLYRKNEEKESIHLTEWPMANEKLIDEKLEKQMKIIQNITEAVNFDRQDRKIKLKYVLPKLTIAGNEEIKEAVESLEELLVWLFCYGLCLRYSHTSS